MREASESIFLKFGRDICGLTAKKVDKGEVAPSSGETF